MSAYYNIPGSTKTPQGVILVDPVTGVPAGGTDAPLLISPLRRLGAARNLDVGAASTEVALTSTCTAVSLTSAGCTSRIKISTAGTDAAVTDHRLMDGERIDVSVEAGSTVAVIAESGTGTLAISELV